MNNKKDKKQLKPINGKSIRLLAFSYIMALVFLAGTCYFLFSFLAPTFSEQEPLRQDLSFDKPKTEEVVGDIDEDFKRNDFKSKGLPISKQKYRPVFFIFVGDIMLDRNVKKKMGDQGVDLLFQDMESGFFDDFDLAGANLEGAVTASGTHYPPVMKYDFAFDPADVSGLKEQGFDFFTIANNHLADQGRNGIIETRSRLKGLGFEFSGCADGIVDDCSFKSIQRKGRDIGIATLSLVYSYPDKESFLSGIARLRSENDIVIAIIHWGVEYKHYYNGVQSSLAKNIIDAGADALIGHHPHVVQGMEIYDNKPIFYSLGNFIFDQYFSLDTQEGLGAALEFRKEAIKVEFYPFRSKGSRPAIMDKEEKAEFLKKFVLWSDLDKEREEAILKEGTLRLE